MKLLSIIIIAVALALAGGRSAASDIMEDGPSIEIGRVEQVNAPVCATMGAAESIATAEEKGGAEAGMARFKEDDACLMFRGPMQVNGVISRHTSADGRKVIVLRVVVLTREGAFEGYSLTDLPIKGELDV